jgi:hypothetical protein
MAQDRDRAELPRAEPEIIMPDRFRRRPVSNAGVFVDSGPTHRVYVARIGPFGGFLLLLLLVVLAIVGLLAFLGVLLIWIPLIALVVLVAGFSGLLRLRRG